MSALNKSEIGLDEVGAFHDRPMSLNAIPLLEPWDERWASLERSQRLSFGSFGISAARFAPEPEWNLAAETPAPRHLIGLNLPNAFPNDPKHLTSTGTRP
jgi:hypothetical protein